MDILNNLDLLSVGVAIAGIGILGFVVYFIKRVLQIGYFVVFVNVD